MLGAIDGVENNELRDKITALAKKEINNRNSQNVVLYAENSTIIVFVDLDGVTYQADFHLESPYVHIVE